MSPKRVTSITVASDDLIVTLTGGIGEMVPFTYSVDNVQYETPCKLNAAGSAKLSIMTQKCA